MARKQVPNSRLASVIDGRGGSLRARNEIQRQRHRMARNQALSVSSLLPRATFQEGSEQGCLPTSLASSFFLRPLLLSFPLWELPPFRQFPRLQKFHPVSFHKLSPEQRARLQIMKFYQRFSGTFRVMVGVQSPFSRRLREQQRKMMMAKLERVIARLLCNQTVTSAPIFN